MSVTTDLIDAEIAAYGDRDLERFLEFYSAEIVIKDADGNVLMDSLEAMRAFYGPMFRDSPELGVEIPRRIDFGEFVIDEELIVGVNMEGFPSELHAAVVYRVKDGKIRGVTFVM
jgi:hypothetical protein